MNYEQYLHDVILPVFEPLIYQNVMSSLFDRDGRIILSTDENARAGGFSSWKDHIGLSYADVDEQLIEQMLGDTSHYTKQMIIASCKKIHQILSLVVSKKRAINFIDLIPYKNKYRSYLETYIPIFHPSGDVVAVQSITTDFKFLQVTDLFASHGADISGKYLHIPDDSPPVCLSPRQHEILYLVLQGIPQEYAAQILNIKRGTLARIISEQICPKFDIYGSNTKLLIERALRLGLQHYMPKSLWFPSVIILDDEIAQLVHSTEERSQ